MDSDRDGSCRPARTPAASGFPAIICVPIVEISPLRSAVGMNCDGGTLSPSRSQRASASNWITSAQPRRHDRLELHGDLAVVDGQPQAGFHVGALHQCRHHLRVEPHVPVLACRLGRVHRDVCLGAAVPKPPRASRPCEASPRLRLGRSMVPSIYTAHSGTARCAPRWRPHPGRPSGAPRTRRRRAGPPTSAVGTQALSRRATSTSIWSPAWWPRMSLTSLKSSRSSRRTSTDWLRCRAALRQLALNTLAVGQPGQRVLECHGLQLLGLCGQVGHGLLGLLLGPAPRRDIAEAPDPAHHRSPTFCGRE